MSALVFFFCLYGKYKSSTCCNLSQASIFSLSSSVSFHCSSIDFNTSCFLTSRFLIYFNFSSISLICSSSRFQVASFLYLDINGTVAHSSSSLTVFST
ncbi:MAG: hypothetical protein ACOZBL_03760 [Patescibacteria group bacterium]